MPGDLPRYLITLEADRSTLHLVFIDSLFDVVISIAFPEKGLTFNFSQNATFEKVVDIKTDCLCT